MTNVSCVVTAAGRNSRMERDQIQKNIPVKNKLILDLNGKTVIETTIANVLSSNVDQCIVVLGHFANDIKEAILNIDDDRIKIIENKQHDIGLSKSLLNGIVNSKNNILLCVAGDQPSVSSNTYNSIIDHILNSKHKEKTISVLRRRKTGFLDTAEGLGMPFAIYKSEIVKYLQNENDNLNPILKRMFKDKYIFYGVKELNKYELVNINTIDDYKLVLDSL